MIFRICHPIVREFGEFEGGREVVGQNRGFVSLGTLDFLQQLQLEGCYLLLKESYFVTGPLIRTVGGLNFFHIFIIVIVLLILANILQLIARYEHSADPTGVGSLVALETGAAGLEAILP
ncbi:hypothetical protein Gohar_001163 [Gossypium harknessii]|uniref:Uncharacterized protein n=1 Tax=Gossypium harknessii TaxID=34285 RepID=A0A7J9I307_9ROSI|nr:hypothetical protein [Gossypium harknessii]